MDGWNDEDERDRRRFRTTRITRVMGEPGFRFARFDSFSDEEVERRKGSRRKKTASPPPITRRRVAFEEPSPDPLRSRYMQRVPSPPAPRRTMTMDAGLNITGLNTRVSRDRNVPSPPPPFRPGGAPAAGDKPAAPPPSGHRRRVSFNDYRPTTPPSDRRREKDFLSPPDDPAFYGVKRDRSPRVQYSSVAQPPSPSLVPVVPVRAAGGTANPGKESRGRTWSRERSGVGFLPEDLSRSRPSTPPPMMSGALGDNVYRYKPLGHKQFRLVQIQPIRMAVIKCSILHCSLSSPPRYTAISYAWGDPDDTRRIIVEGVSISVRASLYGALEVLRQRSDPVLVWVDAISVDQSNHEERTQQVQLMASIYNKAESVAVWLGPEADDSSLAMDLLHRVTDVGESSEKVRQLLSSLVGKRDVGAVVCLFERDYWRRLWVVQEVFNARSITVYCGSRKLPYAYCELASRIFQRHRSDLDRYYPGSSYRSHRDLVSSSQYSYSQVLVHQGPASLPDLKSLVGSGEESLLEVLRTCRRKLAEDPKDKVYGLLGVLPEAVRRDFTPDYSLSVKKVYTDVVDFLMVTTERVDVICEAIHFPLHTDSASLPSFVPNWSHIPQTASLCSSFNFRASGSTKAQCKFLDEQRNKLQVTAIFLDTIKSHGVAVGTLCTLADYLMAFLHWRALLLGSHDAKDDAYSFQVQEAFCRTLSLGQAPSAWKGRPRAWMEACYLVFASQLRERLPQMPLDKDLSRYVNAKVDAIKPDDRRRFLQEHFGNRMMGRCFCLTTDGRLGMGTGYMAPGDVVVVPLGCDTPILIRPEGNECRYVGDVYINGYMQGKAVEQWREGAREVRKYILH